MPVYWWYDLNNKPRDVSPSVPRRHRPADVLVPGSSNHQVVVCTTNQFANACAAGRVTSWRRPCRAPAERVRRTAARERCTANSRITLHYRSKIASNHRISASVSLKLRPIQLTTHSIYGIFKFDLLACLWLVVCTGIVTRALWLKLLFLSNTWDLHFC